MCADVFSDPFVDCNVVWSIGSRGLGSLCSCAFSQHHCHHLSQELTFLNAHQLPPLFSISVISASMLRICLEPSLLVLVSPPRQSHLQLNKRLSTCLTSRHLLKLWRFVLILVPLESLSHSPRRLLYSCHAGSQTHRFHCFAAERTNGSRVYEG